MPGSRSAPREEWDRGAPSGDASFRYASGKSRSGKIENRRQAGGAVGPVGRNSSVGNSPRSSASEAARRESNVTGCDSKATADDGANRGIGSPPPDCWIQRIS